MLRGAGTPLIFSILSVWTQFPILLICMDFNLLALLKVKLTQIWLAESLQAGLCIFIF